MGAAEVWRSLTMTRKAPRAKPQDVITLADLAPRQRVVGGSERRVFGSDALVKRAVHPHITTNPQEHTMAKSAKKDLPAKATVKGGRGGRLASNDNLTLVRAAKPAKRDLPAGKDIKGGKKKAR
jgi:hypothetical protein